MYDNLVYTNEAQETFTGTEAASEIGGDCIFGSETSEPPLNGCPRGRGAGNRLLPELPQLQRPGSSRDLWPSVQPPATNVR